MTLAPKLPPGRANRKALQYAVDIRRLRGDGYTFSAIRLALLDAGISVSHTTIQREAARRDACDPPAPQRIVVRTVPRTPSNADVGVPTTTSFAGDARSGREIAESFTKGRITNPLIQERNRDESRSDQLLG